MQKTLQVADCLLDIEAHLRQLRLWSDSPPAAEALASDQPFCIDTLTLPQWLQYIFIPTLYQLIEQGGPLPTECAITPMAQEYFRGTELAVEALLKSLSKVDAVLSSQV